MAFGALANGGLAVGLIANGGTALSLVPLRGPDANATAQALVHAIYGRWMLPVSLTLANLAWLVPVSLTAYARRKLAASSRQRQ